MISRQEIMDFSREFGLSSNVIEKDYALVGGGARNSGLVKALEAVSGFPIIVPPDPHLTAALGAALIAAEAGRT